MKGQYLYALVLAPLWTAVGATPNAEAEAAPHKERIPPCAGIRCIYGAPFYDRKTKQCLCPPQCDNVCPTEKPEVYYDWTTRECSCRAIPYYLEKRDAAPEPAPQPQTTSDVCPNVVCPPGKAPCDCTQDLPSSCFATTCLVGTDLVFNPKTGLCECRPQLDPCALILCAPDTVPEVDPATNTCKCVPVKPPPSCRKFPCPYTHEAVYDLKLRKCKCRRRPVPY